MDEKRILIIDDEPLIRRSLADHLSFCGFQSQTAADGAEGLHRARTERFDVILVDLRMPQVDGLEVIDALKVEQPALPLVVVSGTGVLSNAIEAMRRGAWDYIAKPIQDLDEILVVIERALKRAELMAERDRYQQELEQLNRLLEVKVARQTEDLRAQNRELAALNNELRHIEQALRQSEALYRSIVDTIPDGLTLIEAGRAVFVSERACDIFGYERDEYVRMNGLDFAAPEERERLVAVQESIERAGVRPDTLEFWIVCKNGDRRCIQNRYAFIEGEGGAVKRLVITTDITARKLAEAQLREYTERLEQLVAEKVSELERERAKAIQSARLFSLAEMATGVVHELNRPLTSILFDADYLRAVALKAVAAQQIGPDLGQELDQIGEALVGDVAYCRRITDYLRTFSRLEGGYITEIDLNRPIEYSFTLVAGRLQDQGIQVQRQLLPDLPLIMADAHKLEQVFQHLISNAEHALQEMERRIQSGQVARRDYQKVLRVSTFVDGAQTVVAVVYDNGCGIAERDRPRVFEPFFTTKPLGRAIGVGLSISYGMVSEFGGEISFESVENEGTTFTLRFPVRDVLLV